MEISYEEIQDLKTTVINTQNSMDRMHILYRDYGIKKYYQNMYDTFLFENKRAKAKLILLGVKQ